LRYDASGMIDAIADRPSDHAQRDALLQLVAEGIEAVIAHEGVFRDPKPVGCLVVTKSSCASARWGPPVAPTPTHTCPGGSQ